MDKVKFLKQEIILTPGDPFNYYLIALELIKSGQVIEADEYINLLLLEHPDYLASYYTFATMYIESEREEEAYHLVIKGIQLAERLKNDKARRELQALLDLHF